mmetsp:Transcript_2975/g.5423  ORF Transcript_2975/g.5423 Transcript_2975/m.5423 type:complete len:326 (+) Transcript_2975:105-1082(+)
MTEVSEAAGPQPQQKSCSCVGIRSCRLCEDPGFREAHQLHPIRAAPTASTGTLHTDAEGVSVVVFEDGRAVHPENLPVPFVGFHLFGDVIEDEETETAIIQEIEAWPWQPSQSGRWKQDFGPRANFKKRQLKIPAEWHGVPEYAHRLLRQLRARSERLHDFEVAEFLTLKYDVTRGANHALHVDDLWLWGERILGVSLLGASVFTFFDPVNNIAIRVPLPRRSAYLISDRVRVDWQHGIFTEDIENDRIALTYRELTPVVAATDLGRVAIARAQNIIASPSLQAADVGNLEKCMRLGAQATCAAESATHEREAAVAHQLMARAVT